MRVSCFDLAHWHWPTALATATVLLNAAAILYHLATVRLLKHDEVSIRYLHPLPELDYLTHCRPAIRSSNAQRRADGYYVPATALTNYA